MNISELTSMSIDEMSGRMRQGTLSVQEVLSCFLHEIRERNPALHAFITVDEDTVMAEAGRLDALPLPERNGKLFGIPVSVKDNILTKGLRTTAGSAFLRSYVPDWDAEAVRKLRAAGAVIIGKTNLDEFGMGSKTENRVYGDAVHPRDPFRSPGGSSGGAAVSVSAGMCMAALGSDTGGSIRQPAAYCGLVGLKPSYGAVSRSGLISYASSMDQIGVLGRKAADVRTVLSVILGRDEKDDTSVSLPSAAMEDFRKEDEAGLSVSPGSFRDLRVGIPVNLLEHTGISEKMAGAVKSFAEFLEEKGASVQRFLLPDTDLFVPVYYILACCEASSNLGRYDGIRYGTDQGIREPLTELYRVNRTAGFSEEVRRRILMGTYMLSEEHYTDLYVKAERVRERIVKAYEEAFRSYDLLLSPVVPGEAPLLRENSRYEDDLFTVGANLAGLPALSLPYRDVSVQLTGNRYSEGLLLRVLEAYERTGGAR